MQGRKNREWLIKSSGEIRGPFTFEEISEGLASKEFVLVDEVSCKFSRWKYLREEEAFEKVILELKNKEFSKGDKTFTSSDADTDTGSDTLTEELGDNVLNFSKKNHLLSNVQVHLKEKEDDRLTNQKTSFANEKNEEVKSYAAEAQLKKKASASNSFTKFLIFLLVIGGLAAVFFINKKEKPLSYDDLKKIAYDDINYGDFESAKTYLEKALAVNSTNEELKYLLSYVSVELDDGITAQRLLSDLDNTATDQKLKSQAYNLNGILQLKNFNLKDAAKNFESALKINPKFAAALFNLGVASYLDNKFDLAMTSFNQSLENGGSDGNILLSMAEMKSRDGQELSTDQNKKKSVEDTLNLIIRQSNNLSSYKQELKVAAAYLYYLIGDNAAMEKNIDEAIDIDPTLTSDHVNDTLYYRGLVTWDRMSQWIKKMKEAHPNNENLTTLYGYSLFKGSDKLKGKDVIEGLLKSNYSNTSNQIIYSYILMTLRREDEARAALAPIMHHRDKSLSFVLMGKLCLIKKDYPCSDLNFSEALRIDKNNLTAEAGLADVYFEQKDYKKSTELMNQVFRTSPTYKPILKVKQKLEIAKK
jgi:Tfp pilus assembly protein PilF